MSRGGCAPVALGRYEIHDEIASGGMATVHLGRFVREGGETQTVAIKRLHPHFARDPIFITMFLDEVRLAARVHHPNVVRLLDSIAAGSEVVMVLEYIEGESLAYLLRGATQPIAPSFVSKIAVDVLRGLAAAHGARDERGEALEIVHRDVSPQNILVGVDGVARVLDFGVAKAAGRIQTTREGQIKGKMAYMAPEQLTGGPVDARTDVYALGVVLWEAFTGRRLFDGDNDGRVLARVLAGASVPPSQYVPAVPEALDTIVMKALECNPEDRFASADEMALAIESVIELASEEAIGAWVASAARPPLLARSDALSRMQTIPFLRVATPAMDSVAHADERESGLVRANPATSPTSPTRPAVFGLLALAFGAVGWVAFTLGRSNANAETIDTASPSALVPAAEAASAQAESTPPPVEHAGPIAAPAETTTATTTTTTKSAASAPPKKTKVPRSNGPTAAPKKSCAAVTYDAEGKAKVHPECL